MPIESDKRLVTDLGSFDAITRRRDEILKYMEGREMSMCEAGDLAAELGRLNEEYEYLKAQDELRWHNFRNNGL